MYRSIGKRIFDLILAIPAILVLLPVWVALALLVRWQHGPPILFRQKRPGLHGRSFTIYKFRTMTDEQDAQGTLLPDSQRLTRLGRFLRRTSLDELPELWNVLKGDMSLVGPRPLLEEYLPYYTEREQLRHTVPPGITGLAQINGRNWLPWDERLELDVQYVENCSFQLDLYILFVTFLKVIMRKDVVDAPGTVYDKLNVHRDSAKAGMS